MHYKLTHIQVFLKTKITNSKTISTPNKEGLLKDLGIIDDAFSGTPRIGTSIDAATIRVAKNLYSVKNIAPTTGTGGNSLFIVKGSSGIETPGIFYTGGETIWYGRIGKDIEVISATNVDDLVTQLKNKGVNIVKDINNPDNIILKNERGLFIYKVDPSTYYKGIDQGTTLIYIGPYIP